MLMAWETCSEITFPQVHSDSLLICYGKKWFLIVLNYIFVFQDEHLSVCVAHLNFVVNWLVLYSFPISL